MSTNKSKFSRFCGAGETFPAVQWRGNNTSDIMRFVGSFNLTTGFSVTLSSDDEMLFINIAGDTYTMSPYDWVFEYESRPHVVSDEYFTYEFCEVCSRDD